MKITITIEDTAEGIHVQFAENKPLITMARERRAGITPAQLLAGRVQRFIFTFEEPAPLPPLPTNGSNGE